MRDLYAEKFKTDRLPLSDIIDVSAEEFYGEGYEDSDRRIPDNRKARELLGWQPTWKMRELLEKTMQYYLSEYPELYHADTVAPS